MALTTQQQTAALTAIQIMAKVLRHHKMNKAKAVEYLKSINAWDDRNGKTLLNGAEMAIKKKLL